jgi:NAD(P)-dependent dehydrogenase (short-subunit alcohol dehydrogenase family)
MPDKATADGYDSQMTLNHLSHFLLINAELMPALKAADRRWRGSIGQPHECIS